MDPAVTRAISQYHTAFDSICVFLRYTPYIFPGTLPVLGQLADQTRFADTSLCLSAVVGMFGASHKIESGPLPVAVLQVLSQSQTYHTPIFYQLGDLENSG